MRVRSALLAAGLAAAALAGCGDDDDGPPAADPLPEQSELPGHGGTEEADEWSRTPSPEIARDVLSRAARLVPEVAEARVLRHRAGLRPWRDRVRVERRDAADGEDTARDELVATPTRASGSGVLSSVALSDGWVVVPESREGVPAGETVTVEQWEFYP